MKSRNLYVITGITGKVGGVLARTLLAANQPVRAVPGETCQGTFRITGNARSIALQADPGGFNEGLIDFEGDQA